MKSELLQPQVATVGAVLGTRKISELAAEPCLFSCDMRAAEVQGGDITAGILEQVRQVCKPAMLAAYEAGLSEVIDVRVQRLMPGMYPSIPGWHCDAVPRADYWSQPDFARLNPASFHVTTLVDTYEGGHQFGLCPTVFLDNAIKFNYDETRPVWKQLHQQIEAAPQRTRYVRPGELLCFDSRSPHKATACRERGWRLFFRLSMYHRPPVVNKVQTVQQVYVLSEENGW